MTEKIREQVDQLPSKPGVYFYYDQTGQLLYIGKATSLRRRVSSYFARPQIDPRIAKLVDTIDSIEFQETNSVIEALFLEAYLINTKQPPYNVRQKDDKTFANIILTREAYPRVLVSRPTQKQTTPVLYQFGPYTSIDLARLALRIVRRIIPFRTTCQPGSGRGCLDYQIGLCPGPCAGVINQQGYRKLVNKLKLFFEGKTDRLSRLLTKEMTAAAKAHNFETAALIRNQLAALTHIRDTALIKRDFDQTEGQDYKFRRVEAYDISNILHDHAVGSMVVVTNGKTDKAEYRKFQIKTVSGQNDLAMMEEVLTRRFRHMDWPRPDLLIIDGGMNHLKIAQRVLRRANLPIPIVAVAKGPKRDRLDLYPSSPSLPTTDDKLLTTIHLARDEAHRFAIGYHRQKRDSQFLSN